MFKLTAELTITNYNSDTESKLASLALVPLTTTFRYPRTTTLATVFLVSIFLLYSAAIIAMEKLVIGIAANAPPKYAIKRILTTAYNSINVTIEFHELPGRRSIVHANTGVTDAEAFRVKGIDNKFPNLLRIDVPLRVDNMYLYVKKGKEFPVNGWESIPQDYVVGYRRGLLIAEYAVREQQLKYNELPSIDNIGLHLHTGRSDTVILGAVGGSLFKELGAHNIVRLEPPIHTATLYHYIHKRNKHLIPALTATLKKMNASGQLKQINDSIKAPHR